MEEVPRDDRVRRVGLRVDRGSPRSHRVALVRPQACKAEVQLDDGDLRIELRELLEPVERSSGQVASADPTFASSESCFAKSAAAVLMFPRW